MKRTPASFFILSMIIIYSLSAIWIMKKENSSLISVIYEIQASCDDNNMKYASEKADLLESEILRYEKKMSLFVKDEKLNELNITAAKIKPYIEEANDELEAELSNLRSQLERIYKSEIPYLYNIL